MNENHIRQWADSHECRRKLPILVRRLIRETAGRHLTSFRFPGNEATDLHGLDGEVDMGTATLWIPEGYSVWEMGCNQDPRAKAEGDYKKRVGEIEEEVREAGSFVFVTPRRWPGKQVWLAEKRALNQWANVLAYDAIDLEAWLEEAPVTTRWLGQLLGTAQPGLLTPEEWWTAWSSAANPHITMKLVGTRRQDEAATLLRQLRAGDDVVPVMGDDSSEAAAFVVAALNEAKADDLLDRMLVITGESTAIPDPGGTHPIFLTVLPDGSEINFGDRRRITIIRTYPKGRFDVSEPLQLSHVPAEVFRSELEQMGLTRDEAISLAAETGHSVTVLRRRLSPDPEIRRPVWARDRAVARALLPFALAGSWLDGENYDDAAVLGLLGEMPDNEVRQTRDMLLRQDEAPVACYGSVNVVVSQLDALFAIGADIDAPTIGRFFDLVTQLFGDRDPALDLPPEQRWMASIFGKSRSWSDALLSGLGDALCILSCQGAEICGRRLPIDFDRRAESIVRSLMGAPDGDRWLTIRRQLQSLAEAAPSAFLDCIEADLRRSEPTITSIMGAVENGLTGECLRTELLWSLEMLAWHPLYFRRVAAIVFDLRRFDAKDNWTNSAANTAATLFRAWLPSTAVEVDARLSLLRDLANTYRKATIDVCISLLPRGGPSFATRAARPKWRALEHEVPDATDQDVRRAAIEASRLILDIVPFDVQEMETVLDAAVRLHPDDLERLALEAERWSLAGQDTQKARLQDVLRHEAASYAFREAAESDEAVRAAFTRMEQALEPSNAVGRHRWLFEQQHVEWRAINEEERDGRLTWQERHERVQKQREQALAEIEKENGREAIFPFAISVKHPEIVSMTLVSPDTPSGIAADWIAVALAADNSDQANAFLAQTLLTMGRGDLEGTVRDLLDRGALDELAPRLRVARNLPGIETGWLVAATLGKEAEDAYWQNVHVRLWDDTSNATAQTTITRLLEADRPVSAFAAAQFWPKKISADVWEQVLEGVARGAEPDGPRLDAYSLDQVFARLDVDPDFPLERLVRLELPFTPALSNHGHRSGERTLAVHRALADDPALFVELLSWVYRRTDEPADQDRAEEPDTRKKALWQIAYHSLEGWDLVPGTVADGSIDHASFTRWNEEARRLATEADRLEVSEVHLAGLYARVARRRHWDDWMPAPILDWLERAELGSLRDRFEMGVQNARGVTTRGPYDGGAQERHLADRYRALSKRFENSHPRVAEMVSRIAARYDQEATRADERAAVGERWSP